MARLKIVFRKEIMADLNTYYPHFSPALRAEIDDAIYKMLGGQPIRSRRVSTNAGVSSTGTNATEIFERTKQQCKKPNTKVMALLSNYETGKQYLRTDIVKLAVSKYAMTANNVMHNLVKGGYFVMVE